MYAHCLFCAGGLGRNEALEAFPVGRRLAYDASKGRLWVVCPACQRWNLTPLEERWEAIEQAERMYRGTRLRASTPNVGLARVADRTELIRVGRPLRPELAAWRYGDVFSRRRRRALAEGVAVRVGAAAAAGAFFWWAVSAGVGIPFLLHSAWSFLGSTEQDEMEAEPAIPDGDFVVRAPVSGVVVNLSRHAVELARLEHDPVVGLQVAFPFGNSLRRATGEEARRVAASMLAYVNASGAPRREVDGAVKRLVDAGDAQAFLSQVVRPARARRGYGRPREVQPAPARWSHGICTLPFLDRLAVEMALHEEQEPRALEGELAALERAWRDAEEIAAIADDLLLPDRVRRALARLRGGPPRRAGA